MDLGHRAQTAYRRLLRPQDHGRWPGGLRALQVRLREQRLPMGAHRRQRRRRSHRHGARGPRAGRDEGADILRGDDARRALLGERRMVPLVRVRGNARNDRLYIQCRQGAAGNRVGRRLAAGGRQPGAAAADVLRRRDLARGEGIPAKPPRADSGGIHLLSERRRDIRRVDSRPCGGILRTREFPHGHRGREQRHGHDAIGRTAIRLQCRVRGLRRRGEQVLEPRGRCDLAGKGG